MTSLRDSAETIALLQFWKNGLGGIGTLVTEYPISGRRIDGVVIPGDKPDRTILRGDPVSLEGKNVILIEVKKRLGRTLCGQAFFAIGLVAPRKPASVRSIALCNKDDPALRRLLREHNVDVEFVEPWPESKTPVA